MDSNLSLVKTLALEFRGHFMITHSMHLLQNLTTISPPLELLCLAKNFYN
jgi:hypothetical protein